MTTAKHVTLALAAAGAIFAAGSSFVPGTAEAHCGGHAGSCPQNTLLSTDWYCDENYHRILIHDVYDGYCLTPAGGCSGAGCANWPCESGQCDTGSNHGCYSYSYETDSGYYWVCERL